MTVSSVKWSVCVCVGIPLSLFLQSTLAFGHAKTGTSSNHACFSRYTEFQYDAKGKIIGSKTLDYLLEKSRVIGQYPPIERNFNIFYLLLAGATEEEKSQFYFSDGISFGYLGQQKGRTSTAVVSVESGLQTHYLLIQA